MKVFGKIFLTLLSSLVLLVGLNNPLFAKKTSLTRTIYGTAALTNEINRLIATVNPNLNVGIQINSLQTGDVLYSRSANQMFVPASILKIFTAESALLYLGSQYKFTTAFTTDAKTINNGILEGNLYLVHSGDPSLTYLDLTDLMAALKARHITEVRGNIYIDTSAYDQEMFGPGWISNDTRFCYAAPISASIVNHNCMVMQVSPNKSVGHVANIVPSKNFYISGVQNDVVTKPKGTHSCTIRLGTEEHGITLSGCMPKGKYVRGVSAVVTDVIYYNRSLIQSLFQRYGIHVTGNILPGTAATTLPVIASHDSKPLKDLISEMLKKSDNIIAGSLFKKMGEIYSRQPGSWGNGSLAVKEILKQKIGVDTRQMSVLDGSGLSRDNYISPLQMMQVLTFAFHNDATNRDFISALPIAGVDGTLKNRMQNIRAKVRAKTGTMSGVVALAGYAVSQNKEPLAFVIIINGNLGLGWKYKELENNIMTVLTNYSA